MDTLIAKLEAAPEGSRELDYAIAKETGWVFHGEKEFKKWGMFWRDATTDEWKQLPWWTTSLDAALTLVPSAPPPWNVTMATAYGSASVMPIDGKSTGIHDPRGGHMHGAPTPALALCIAALRARQAMDTA